MKKISKKFIASSIMALASTTAIAAPTILFKDLNNQSKQFAHAAAPKAITNFLQTAETKYPNTSKIIVYKNENHYLIYLLSSKTWEAKKIRLDSDADGKLNNIVYNYTGGINDLNLTNKNTKSNDIQPGVCPDESVQFLAISAYPGVAKVNEAIAIVSEAAKKQFKTMTILDENADGKTYFNWLSCPNLKGVYSIGHGAPDEMLVGNGDVVSYKFFNQPEMKNKYKNTTVIFNACQVYNYPMGTNVMYGNALQESEYAENPGPNTFEYMGGHVNLLMQVSELSSACFMAKAIEGAKMDYDTLQQCVGDKDFHAKNFGLSNPGLYFNKG